MKKLLVVGSSNTDLIIKADRIPRPGETILGGAFTTFPGGKGANQAVAAARAGGEVVFLAAVGDDAYGNHALEGYRKDGIDTSRVKICRNLPSGVAMIAISSAGENAIVVAPGANAALLPEDLESNASVFQGAAFMLIQLETPLETVQKAVEICGRWGTRVILNPAPAAVLPDAILSGTHMITPNETEAELLTGVEITDETTALKASDILHNRGVGTVIITMGARGAFCSAREENIRAMIGGFAVTAVDTTAAGDVFNGQLAVSMSEGRSLRESILRAHAAAALSVQQMGAQSSIPGRQQTEQFLQERINQ